MLKFIHIFSEYDTGTAKVTPVKEETRLEFNEKLSDINEISEVEEYKCVLHVNEKGVAQDFVSSQEFLYFSLYLTELSHENIVLISDITILNSIQPYLSYMSNNQYSFKMGNKSLYIYYIPIDALPMSTIIDQVNNIMIPTLFRANDELSIKNKKLMSTHTYDKFKDFVDMYVMDSKDISFDIETNAHNKYSKTIEIVGFSVAVGDNGIYVCKESLDCKMSNEDWNNTLILIKSILDNHNVIVHNCMYEIPVLVNDWNYEIKNFDDTMIKSRIILGANTGASLKFQCQSNLNYPDWDSDLGIYTESIDKIVTNISPTPSGGGSEYFDELTVNGFKSVLSKLNDISDLELNKKHLSLKHYMISLESLITRYYTDDSERNNIFDKISSLLVLLVNNKFTGLISYGLIPYKIISTYGAMDAIGTYDLNNYLDKKLDKLSDELGVDLSKGYSYLKPQFIVGIWMEMNGLYYDNDVALEVEDWHINSRLNSMRFLMKSDKLSEYLISQNRDNIFKEYIKEDPYRISEFINDKFVVMKSGIKIEGNSRVTTWNNLYDYLIQGSSHDLIPKIDILVRDKLSEIIDTSDYDELKSYFNPNSTSPSTIKLFSDIWLTDEVRVAGFLFYFDIYIDNNDTSNFNDSEKRLENLFVDYKKWKHSNIDSKIDEDDSNSDSYEYHEDFLSLGENITQRSVFILAKNIFDIEYSNTKNSDLVKSIRKYLSEELESIKEDVVIELYNRFMFTGIDIDDTYTWSDELRILYNFRIVKKCSKILTTYIDGNKVGRGQVYKVLTKELNDKDVMLAKRGKTYYEVDGKLSADESFIMQPSYAVCATETFRWRAGLHTLPSSSSVMNIFRSRFKGGVIMAPDFSQMEIRAMAGASNCNNMLDAFKRGVDIHLWNACFTGDTKVLLADGTSRTFKELVQDYPNGEKFWVYSITDSDEITLGEAHHPRITKSVTELIKITLDNGVSYKCTPDHLWRTRNGYVRADNLACGMSITPLYTKSDRGYEMYYDLRSNKFLYTHMLASEIQEPGVSYSGMVRHHVNFDKSDNRPENIKKMKWPDHTKLHQENSWISRASLEEKQEFSKLGNQSRWSHDGAREKQAKVYGEVGRKFLSRGGEFWTNPKYEDARSKVRKQGLINLSSVDIRSEEHGRKISEGILNSEKEIIRRSNHAKNLNTDKNVRIKQILGSYVSKIKKGNNYSVDNLVSRIKEYSSLYSISYDKVLLEYPVLDREDVRERLYYNHKVESVEYISLDTPIEVYDITVDKYNNFALDASIEDNKSGVFVHNSAIWNIPEEEVTSAQRRYAKMSSFSILYGKSPEGFGKDFLHGDIKLANKIYDRFYNAFPEVKDYIDKKHQEVMSRGKVTTPVNLYLSIDPNKIGPEAAMRQSQNYPIQNSGTTMAGNATYKIMEYIKQNDYKSRVILFIHDSIELDIHPDEIIPIGSKVIPLMNKYPLEEFGVPSAADLTVGVSLGQQLEVKEMINNDDFSCAELIVEGFEKDFSSLIDRLKQTNTFSVIDYEDLEDPSPFVVSRGDLFIPRSVIKPTMGETLNIIKRKLILKK